MDKAKGKDKRIFCWSCGHSTMQPRGDFYRCADCGATWNPAPRSAKADAGVVLYETKGDRW